MDLPDAKALKKLADACRKAGITHFKGAGIEFTLAEAVVASPAKAAKVDVQGKIESESLSEEELLFWSVGDVTPFEKGSA